MPQSNYTYVSPAVAADPNFQAAAASLGRTIVVVPSGGGSSSTSQAPSLGAYQGGNAFTGGGTITGTFNVQQQAQQQQQQQLALMQQNVTAQRNATQRDANATWINATANFNPSGQQTALVNLNNLNAMNMTNSSAYAGNVTAFLNAGGLINVTSTPSVTSAFNSQGGIDTTQLTTTSLTFIPEQYPSQVSGRTYFGGLSGEQLWSGVSTQLNTPTMTFVKGVEILTDPFGFLGTAISAKYQSDIKSISNIIQGKSPSQDNTIYQSATNQFFKETFLNKIVAPSGTSIQSGFEIGKEILPTALIAAGGAGYALGGAASLLGGAVSLFPEVVPISTAVIGFAAAEAPNLINIFTAKYATDVGVNAENMGIQFKGSSTAGGRQLGSYIQGEVEGITNIVGFGQGLKEGLGGFQIGGDYSNLPYSKGLFLQTTEQNAIPIFTKEVTAFKSITSPLGESIDIPSQFQYKFLGGYNTNFAPKMNIQPTIGFGMSEINPSQFNLESPMKVDWISRSFQPSGS